MDAIGPGPVGAAGGQADFSHSGTVRTRSFDVDVPFMQLERHGWDIHAVSEGRNPGGLHTERTRRVPGLPAACRSLARREALEVLIHPRPARAVVDDEAVAVGKPLGRPDVILTPVSEKDWVGLMIADRPGPAWPFTAGPFTAGPR